MPAAGAAGQGERGEVADERGAQRRREERTAGWRTMPSNMATNASSRQRRRAQRGAGQAERAATAGSGGARDCSGNWSERSERRLERKARSRSDAPRLTVPFRKPASVIGAIDCIAVCTIIAGSNGRIGFAAIGIVAAAIIATSITGIITAAATTPSAGVVGGSLSCCGGRAAEPPRSAAPQAPARRDGRAARRWRRRGVRPKRGCGPRR